MADFLVVESPVSGIYRVAWRETAPFDPADWAGADANGRLPGRFDDPRADLDESRRFRVI